MFDVYGHKKVCLNVHNAQQKPIIAQRVSFFVLLFRFVLNYEQ